MSSYKKVQTIHLSKADQKRAKKFVNDRTRGCTELYEKRGGFKEIDILAGAMAELGVYRFLKSKGVTVKYPDFKVYEASKKSFDADLTDGVHHFHVKGQTLISKKRYGSSWLMQRYDPLLRDTPKLNYIVPCTVCTETGRVEIHGILSIRSLVDQACFSDCKVPSFNRTKTALYLDHIEGIFTDKATWGFLGKFRSRYEQ